MCRPLKVIKESAKVGLISTKRLLENGPLIILTCSHSQDSNERVIGAWEKIASDCNRSQQKRQIAFPLRLEKRAKHYRLNFWRNKMTSMKTKRVQSAFYGGLSMRWSKKIRAAFFGALLIVICVHTLVAQTGAGSIEGTVTDSTGAVIPAASIHVVNVATGVKTDTKSN